jgi:hypothetical protein
MTKAAFIAIEDRYIASVAATANVLPQNVMILSIDEISATSSRMITRVLLRGISVHVQTMVLIAVGQQTNIEDQSVLNTNLNKNGLPSGTLDVQQMNSPVTVAVAAAAVVTITTPAPGGSGLFGAATASGSAASSNIPIGAIVGGVGGGAVLFVLTFLALRYKKKNEACPLQLASTSHCRHSLLGVRLSFGNC